MESIKQQVEVLLEQEPQLLPAAMAERLGVTEFDVVAALPQEMVAIAPGEQAQTILESLVGFGPVTTIVHLRLHFRGESAFSERQSCAWLLQSNGARR